MLLQQPFRTLYHVLVLHLPQNLDCQGVEAHLQLEVGIHCSQDEDCHLLERKKEQKFRNMHHTMHSFRVQFVSRKCT